ncbi:MAG: MFS transporter [Proteobacteria bacterium]|nr:MFS transporter [Pseudomonadota bacterium]
MDISEEPLSTFAPEENPLLRTFKALRHRNFRIYWTGQTISLIGIWMQTIAQGWLVLRLTNAPFYLGLVSFMNSLPIFLFSLPGGVIADRFDKRKILIFTQACSLCLSLLLTVLTFFKVIEVWHIMVIATVFGVVNSFDLPSRQSFTIEMVGREDLQNAIALNSVSFNAARIVGPAIAGILIAWIGEAGCFFINALSFLAVIISLSIIRTEMKPVPGTGTSLVKDVKEGLIYLRQNTVLMVIIMMIAVSSLFGMSYNVLMPVFAKDVLKVGAQGLGFLMAGSGCGALLGAFSVASRRMMMPGETFLFGSLCYSIFLIAFSFSHVTWLSIILLVGVGGGMIAQNVTANTLVQTTVPNELRGRMMSMYSLVFMGLMPVGNLIAGAIAQKMGAPFAVGLGGAIALSAALFVRWRFPEVRKIS